MTSTIAKTAFSKTDLWYNLDIWQSILMVLFCFLIWTVPSMFSATFIYSIQLFIFLEFILMHSGAFMGMLYPFGLFFFLPIYGYIAFMLNKVIPGNAILIYFSLTMLLRSRGIFMPDRASFGARSFVKSFGSFFLTCICFAITYLLSSIIPRWGLTDAFLHSINYYSLAKAQNNIKIYHFIMFGFFYYLGQILLEWWLTKYIRFFDDTPTDEV